MEELILKPNETELVTALHSGLELPMPFEQDIFLYGTEVAGTSHRENIEELFYSLREGDLVTLIREPENPYDEYAIRIDIDADGKPGYNPAETDLSDLTFQLGYVPRAFNKPFARLMDAGKLLYGTIRNLEREGNYFRIVIKIYMRD